MNRLNCSRRIVNSKTAYAQIGTRLTLYFMISSLLALSGIHKVKKWLTLSEAGNEMTQGLFFLDEADICELSEEAFDVGVYTHNDLPMKCALVLLNVTFDVVKQPVGRFTPAGGTLADKFIVELSMSTMNETSQGPT